MGTVNHCDSQRVAAIRDVAHWTIAAIRNATRWNAHNWTAIAANVVGSGIGIGFHQWSRRKSAVDTANIDDIGVGGGWWVVVLFFTQHAHNPPKTMFFSFFTQYIIMCANILFHHEPCEMDK